MTNIGLCLTVVSASNAANANNNGNANYNTASNANYVAAIKLFTSALTIGSQEPTHIRLRELRRYSPSTEWW